MGEAINFFWNLNTSSYNHHKIKTCWEQNLWELYIIVLGDACILMGNASEKIKKSVSRFPKERSYFFEGTWRVLHWIGEGCCKSMVHVECSLATHKIPDSLTLYSHLWVFSLRRYHIWMRRCRHINVSCKSVFNVQKLETSQASISRGLIKLLHINAINFVSHYTWCSPIFITTEWYLWHSVEWKTKQVENALSAIPVM